MIEINLAIKRCYSCKQWFPQTDKFFYKDCSKRDNLCPTCKQCRSLAGKIYYQKNKSYFQKNAKKSYKKNKESRKNYQRCWRKENPDHMKKWRENNPEYAKKYYQKNRKEILKRQKQQRKENKEHYRKYKRQYYKKNKEHLREAEKRYYNENPRAKLSDNISGAIYKSLKNGKGGHRWEILVDYTLEELMTHLESQFKPDMTWDNHGRYGWHIDHIRPISSFNFESFDDQEFKECWALENLQPLWAVENLSKGNKILEQVEPDEKKD